MKGYIVKSNYKVASHRKDEMGCTSKLNTSLSDRCQGGTGRSDLFIKSVSRRGIAIVVEFKIANYIDDLERKADETIEKIEESCELNGINPEDLIFAGDTLLLPN